MSEAVRVRAYDWMREQADATVAEYVMSRLSTVPAADLATKADVARVESKVDRLVELREAEREERAAEREADLKARAAEREERAAEREADLKARAAEREERAAEREADLKARAAEREERAAEREADLKARAAERDADLKARLAERDADRKELGRRTWRIALALPVEVVVLFAGAAAILEWLRG